MQSEFSIEGNSPVSINCLVHVLVAQWIERSPPKRQVAGSILAEDDILGK